MRKHARTCDTLRRTRLAHGHTVRSPATTYTHTTCNQAEAKLVYLVKPDRHVVEFVLEAICVLPTPPVRTSTPRATDGKSARAASSKTAPKETSVFDSIDLTKP